MKDYDFYDKEYSEQEIREYIEKNHGENLGWEFFDNISRYQTLSEDFIREFQNNLTWVKISQFQNLSEEFMIEFIERIKIYEWVTVEFDERGYIRFVKPNSGGLMSNKLIPEDVKERVINLKKIINSS